MSNHLHRILALTAAAVMLLPLGLRAQQSDQQQPDKNQPQAQSDEGTQSQPEHPHRGRGMRGMRRGQGMSALAQKLNLTDEQKQQFSPDSSADDETIAGHTQRRLPQRRPEARQDAAIAQTIAPADVQHPYAGTKRPAQAAPRAAPKRNAGEKQRQKLRRSGIGKISLQQAVK